MHSITRKNLEVQNENSNTANLEMNLRSMDDMPIRALCALSKGALRRSTAQAIVCLANGQLIRGIGYAIKKQ